MREKLVTDLKTLRDEARVRFHLAAMDLREAWHSMAPMVVAVERDLGATGRDAIARARHALSSARRRIRPPVDSSL